LKRTKEVIDEHDPRHSLLSVDIVEYFRRVLESDRSFTKRVADCEEVNKAVHR
jgi:hypothetical protein